MKTILDIETALTQNEIPYRIDMNERRIYIAQPDKTGSLIVEETPKANRFSVFSHSECVLKEVAIAVVMDYIIKHVHTNENKTIVQVFEAKKTFCMCCGKTFTVQPDIEQPLCINCYPIAVKMLFSGIYDDLTAKEFRNAVRNKVLGAENETGN